MEDLSHIRSVSYEKILKYEKKKNTDAIFIFEVNTAIFRIDLKVAILNTSDKSD